MKYSLAFSERLIEAAESFFAIPNNTADEAPRAVLYLSLLSCEISLKVLLEQAGFPIKEIRKRSHDLEGLLEDVGTCELSNTGPSKSIPRKGVRLRAEIVVPDVFEGTVGGILTAESKGASKYPNEVRYSDLVRNFEPKYVLDCAKVLNAWAKENMKNIKRVRKEQTMENNQWDRQGVTLPVGTDIRFTYYEKSSDCAYQYGVVVNCQLFIGGKYHWTPTAAAQHIVQEVEDKHLASINGWEHFEVKRPNAKQWEPLDTRDT